MREVATMPLDLSNAHLIQSPPALYTQESPEATALALWQFDASTWTHRVELVIAQHEIEKLASMPADWDGYGALPISGPTKDNAKRAIALFSMLAPFPDIVPNSNGTLSFEWETQTGFAHLEIGQTKFSFYLKPVLGPSALLDGKANDIPADIGRYVAAMLYSDKRTAQTISAVSFTARHV
jgi:hypothetical protein